MCVCVCIGVCVCVHVHVCVCNLLSQKHAKVDRQVDTRTDPNYRKTHTGKNVRLIEGKENVAGGRKIKYADRAKGKRQEVIDKESGQTIKTAAGEERE